MAKKLNKIAIVDIESTCWDEQPPQGMENEIIEIGICLLDVHSGKITKNKGILVEPIHSEISDFCTELTTITPEMIEDEGISFKEAVIILEDEYDTRDITWASYGAYDQRQFQRQCSSCKVKYPFGPSHINVKTLFALKYKLDREVGMEGALKRLKLPLEGTHHRGVDDAKNIAKILWEIIK